MCFHACMSIIMHACPSSCMQRVPVRCVACASVWQRAALVVAAFDSIWRRLSVLTHVWLARAIALDMSLHDYVYMQRDRSRAQLQQLAHMYVLCYSCRRMHAPTCAMRRYLNLALTMHVQTHARRTHMHARQAARTYNVVHLSTFAEH